MAKPVCLNDISKEDLKKFLGSFDHVFSDCDGVIWTKAPMPGSGDFFKVMQELGKTVHFVSNNSIRSKADYTALFDAVGQEKGFDRLTIPSIAIVEYLKSVKFDKTVYCVSSMGTINVLEANGFKCKYGPDSCPEDYHDFAQFGEDDPDIGAVVFDSDFKVNVPKLQKASTYLKRPEVLFICGASDRLVPLKAGCLGIGPGAFTEMVRDIVKRDFTLLAKPSPTFGQLAMKRAGVTDPSRVLFIGDMIEQDIGLGRATGFHTLLVLTNHTKEEMHANSIQPEYYASCLGDIVPQLKQLLSN
ncbi:unnamed protein product [Plutella xylostella]|uniref:(diamondback moth) hypothetical protein n=1 Tax=Plutella xylostella TaxID=51655 RepID=A0A8S4FVI1_PLUXY|nr:unnamed protein product [Plutella xylostella]